MQPPFGFQLVFNTKAMSATMKGNIGVGAGPVGPVLTGPLFRKKLVGVTIITINTCVFVHAAAACSTSG